jgi:hypothetical protein
MIVDLEFRLLQSLRSLAMSSISGKYALPRDDGAKQADLCEMATAVLHR